MLTAVIYQNGNCTLVSTDHLDQLIHSGEIKQFLRSEGWATINVQPIRKERRVDYKGPERRQRFASFVDDKLINIKLTR
jgi:hypothetical protein